MGTILFVVGFQAFLTMLLVYLNQRFRGEDRYLILICLAIFLHSSYKYLLFSIFGGGYYFENINGSFSILYGPLAYFYFRSCYQNQIPRKTLFLHSSPFLLMLVFNLIVLVALVSGQEHTLLLKIYHLIILISVGFSFCGYCIYFIMVLIQKEFLGMIEKERKKIFMMFAGSYGFIALLVIIGVSSQYFSISFPFSLRYPFYFIILFMFAGIIHFKMRIAYLENESIFKVEKLENAHPVKTKYKTSKLEEKELESIIRQLEAYFAKNKPFLDPDLNLDELSHLTQIPKNHITQALNIHLGQSFYQYINNARVEESIRQLKKLNSDNISQVGFESGFKSKSTFYKYFKEKTGFSPLEFRDTTIA